VDLQLINSLFINKIDKYYDVNLFLENLPFNFKKIFPAKKHLFMPNNEMFINTIENIEDKERIYKRYDELKSIDYVLCKTKLCNSFFNFIKYENKNTRKYKYETLYTKFTSIVKDFTDSTDSIDSTYSTDSNIENIIDPNLFIHFAGKSPYKNTPDLINCWIKNKGFLNIDPDIKLIITCYAHCYEGLKFNLHKYFNKYNIEKDPDVIINYNTKMATYKNMTIHLKPIDPFTHFIDIIKKANVAICISNREGYGHYINEARYMKKFIITMNYPPMNELVIDKDDKRGNGNGILLKKNKFNKYTYKETKFNLKKVYPNKNELRDSIIWCIKHKHELRKLGENGRKMFLDDKKYFEDKMGKFIRSKL